MTKRFYSLLMALAMVLPLMSGGTVGAEVSDRSHAHDDDHCCGRQCPGGTVQWTQWGDPQNPKTTLPAESGHYYLGADIQLTAANQVAAGKDITICLNGYKIRAKSGSRVGYVYGKLTIADCGAYVQDGQYISGAVVGGTAADGAVFGVRRGGTLVLESGKLTGGKTLGTFTGGGVFIQKGTAAGPGGIMYMYGGEISGNEGNHGGAVYLGGADAGCACAAFYMYGGTITGNTARGNGGGIYGEERAIVAFYGGTITGNTAAGTGRSVYIGGSQSQVSASGTVVLDGIHFAGSDGLRINALAAGTSIVMTALTTDITQMVRLDGRQDSWNPHWITANGESVSMVEGVFRLGHYHGDVKYEPWVGGTAHNSLPNNGKNYYLANDIVRNPEGMSGGAAVTIDAGVTQRLCLNGHTITHNKAAERLYNIHGSFTLEDCTAYTDGEGNYVSGGLTYGNADPSICAYGSCISVQRGGTLTVEGGQIYGFHSVAAQAGAAIYVQGANTAAKAVFHLRGGEIHSNRTGAVHLARATGEPADLLFSEVNISGGKIRDNTTAGEGAVYVSGGNTLTITGDPVIFDNQGGNLYLADTATIRLGEMTGGKIGIAAEKADRGISTPQNADPTPYFYSDDRERVIRYKESCLYLGSSHAHGIDGKAGDMGFTRWTATDSLPTEAGCYYLADHVKMKDTFTLEESVILCLNGKTVTAAAGKRILAVEKGCTLTITDCCGECGTITGGTGSYGGAFYLLRGSTLNLYNGCITGNSSTEDGGGVYVQPAEDSTAGTVLNMYGGRICGNSAKRGGGVYTCQGSVLKLAGGSITGNRATVAAGGIYVHSQIGKLLAEGVPVVKENKLGTQSSNICLMGNSCLTDTGVQQGAQLFITAEKADRIVSDAAPYAVAACFFSDSPFREMVKYGGDIYCMITDEHGHCDCAGAKQGCSHLQTRWQAWESTDSLPTKAGYYYLLSDVSMNDRVTVSEDVHICLNGKTVTAPEGKRHITVAANAVVTITDCGDTGRLTGGDSTFGAAVNVARMGIFRMYGGSITGNHAKPTDATGLGGAVYLQAGNAAEAGAAFQMYGGSITENTGYHGGGICVAAGNENPVKPAWLLIAGGRIDNNRATNSGGAVYAGEHSVLTVTGGSFANNAAQRYGGGLYFGNGEASVENATITGNCAMAGGGVFVDKQMKLQIDGCTVQNNRADTRGAGIFQNSDSWLTVKNSKLIANTGKGTGSAIYAGGDLILESTLITGNKTTDGTAVYVAAARDDTKAEIRLGGDLQIWGNKGTMKGDLYFGKGVVAYSTAAGFGKDTRIRIQIHSGFLTDVLLAAYNYEGGNRVYTVTYGDRSLTDPECAVEEAEEEDQEKTKEEIKEETGKPPVADTAQADRDEVEKKPATDTVLYAVLGVFILVVAAGMILLVLYQKKPKKTDGP